MFWHSGRAIAARSTRARTYNVPGDFFLLIVEISEARRGKARRGERLLIVMATYRYLGRKIDSSSDERVILGVLARASPRKKVNRI